MATAKRKKKAATTEPRKQLRDTLHLVAPGTKVREAISAIIQSHNGALICMGNEKQFAALSEGGIELDAPCTPQLLYELAKMDGAIILSDDGERIRYANRFLAPDNSFHTNETGTRHRAAERMARQTGGVIIAVSERRSSVTVFVDHEKHMMDSIPTLLNKATQAIQTLEKYIYALNQTMEDLTAREFQDMVTIFDVCKAVQRCEMVNRIAKEIEPYILELGTEGRLTALQLQELIQPVKEAELVIRDYYREKPGITYEQVKNRIREIPEKELLEVSNISQALGYGTNLRNVDAYLMPRGYRALTMTHRLSPKHIEDFVDMFGSLQSIMRASIDELCKVEGIGETLAERLRVSLNLLRNQVSMDLTTR